MIAAIPPRPSLTSIAPQRAPHPKAGDVPDLIKLDIEGAEIAALRAAQTFLEEFRPTIYTEVNPAHRNNLYELLEIIDYTWIDPSDENWSSRRGSVAISSANILAGDHRLIDKLMSR